MPHFAPAALAVRRRRQAAVTLLHVLLYGLLTASAATAQSASADAAERLLKAGRHAEAKAMLQDLARRNPRDARIASLAGWAHLQLGDADAAVRELERAVRLDPRDALDHVRLGEAYALQLSGASTLRQRAIAERMRGAYERALELAPSQEVAHLRLAQYYMQAPAIAGGDTGKAREHAEAFRTSNAFVGGMLLSAVHRAAGDMNAFERTLREVIAAHPDSFPPRGALADYYGEQRRDPEVWPLLRPFVETEQPHTGALYIAGRLSAVSGRDLERGERALREYLRRTPGSGEPPHAAAHTRLGDILRHRGDIAGARREYEAALRLDPEFQLARDALRRLR